MAEESPLTGNPSSNVTLLVRTDVIRGPGRRMPATFSGSVAETRDFIRRCAKVADSLTQLLDRLFNGRYFVASQDSDTLNMSSIAPLYPMHVIDWNDPRALSTRKPPGPRGPGGLRELTT